MNYVIKYRTVVSLFQAVSKGIPIISGNNTESLYICKVKFLILVFALYTMLLPCLPCVDAGESNDVSQIVVSRSTGQDQEHANEICNPFCSCACCGNILIPNFQLNKLVCNRPLQKSGAQYLYVSIYLPSDFFGNIWQPPKFS